MSQTQIINFRVERTMVFEPGANYQMLVDGFGNVAFINTDTGNYLPSVFHEVI